MKSIPSAPWSHPFIERVIGTIRRECLNQSPFWNAIDFTKKLGGFRNDTTTIERMLRCQRFGRQDSANEPNKML